MDDADAVADIVAASDIALQGSADYAASDVRHDWRHCFFDLQSDAWLVTSASGQVVAYASLFHEQPDRLYVDACVHPDYAGRGIGTFLLDAAERRAHERLRAAPVETPVILGQGINARNEAARRLLEGAGYRHVRTFWNMRIAFDEAPPTPQWPVGLAVRAFVPGADDYKVWAAGDEAFQDHWEHHTEPFEQWRQQRLSREGFDPSLWFLALDGDEVAGLALCRYRVELGWVGTLGVRRPWRGQGLGLALLRHAFGEFYRRGVRTVGLGVDAESLTGATRLYERAGMRVERQYDVYDKEVQALR
jgi:mycothiol synthase